LGEGGETALSMFRRSKVVITFKRRYHPRSLHPVRTPENNRNTSIASTQDIQIPFPQLVHNSQTHNGLTRNVDASPPSGRQSLHSRHDPSQLLPFSTHARGSRRSHARPQTCWSFPWRVRNIPTSCCHPLSAFGCTANRRRVT
jgi:hypothetical protein